jgi:hypothetical protein
VDSLFHQDIVCSLWAFLNLHSQKSTKSATKVRINEVQRRLTVPTYNELLKVKCIIHVTNGMPDVILLRGVRHNKISERRKRQTVDVTMCSLHVTGRRRGVCRVKQHVHAIEHVRCNVHRWTSIFNCDGTTATATRTSPAPSTLENNTCK